MIVIEWGGKVYGPYARKEKKLPEYLTVDEKDPIPTPVLEALGLTSSPVAGAPAPHAPDRPV